MSAVPRATAVTNPLASTVAIDSSLDDQVTAWLVASGGDTVAVKLVDCPSSKVRLAGSNATPSTGISSPLA